MTPTNTVQPHREVHCTGSEAVRDIVLGMSDNLTVPFALAAGLSGAVESSGIILTTGLTEVADQDECPAINDLTALLIEHGPAAMASARAALMNRAMRIEREQVLTAEAHQRTADRQGYANGIEPMTLKTRVGRVDLRIPQTRDYRDENGRPCGSPGRRRRSPSAS